MLIHLHGYFEGDFLGLVCIGVGDTKIGDVATQLSEWVLELRVAPIPGATGLEISNENGDLLDPEATLDECGLTAGDLFRVKQVA